MAGKSQKTPTYLVCLYVLGMLMSGTLNTLTTKIQFTLESKGITGEIETFQKPWFGTLNMLLAMTMVLVVEQCIKGCTIFKKEGSGEVPLMDDADLKTGDTPAVSWGRKVCLVAYPAGFDLLATAFCCMGILYIPASVWQILRGASIIFAALFSVLFLRRKLFPHHYIGLALCVSGVILVGMASVWGAPASEDSSQNDALGMVFGMTLVMAGQVVQAAQVIAEEWLMKDVDLPMMQIVGFEGIWGVLMMFIIVYPILYIIPGPDHGSMESAADTFVMLSNSPELLQCVALYLFSCGTFNATGIAVTGALSAVHRMMLDASRTTVIWAFGLYVHYNVDANSKFGEAWTDYSYLQLIGFLVLVLGQSVYGEVLRLPCLRYPEPAKDASQFASPGAMMHLASPLPPAREYDMVEES